MKPKVYNFSSKTILLLATALLFFAFLPNQTAQAQTEAGEVLMETDEMPQPKGGLDGWMAYLTENMKYPVLAKEKNIEGTVIVTFVVLETGEIDTVEILRGIGGGCDEEAMRLVKESPKWTPGKKDGELVKVRMRLPVRFKL
ncbi:energy transducer TonB [Algoriphagus winogradskyi]|uniref:TonB family C-terminal domain-containing protein n=1 Tax=Algoriphagus winogradskyi TaxID=237017 RepID=A0ABY1PGJ2_9BACT|nr:energy transducer TonB [Algoriphagus winogradskyi]SMP33139.1 TonB family C-terminal domain-containing protein [Algoriphagus winogradskyi]